MRNIVPINISPRRGLSNSAARVSKRLTLCATAYLRARYCIHALKADSQRPLHHARRASGVRLAKKRIGQHELARCGVASEGQIGIDVVEIRVVEKIVCLPSE